jgi:hypothetical protein
VGTPVREEELIKYNVKYVSYFDKKFKRLLIKDANQVR